MSDTPTYDDIIAGWNPSTGQSTALVNTGIWTQRDHGVTPWEQRQLEDTNQKKWMLDQALMHGSITQGDYDAVMEGGATPTAIDELFGRTASEASGSLLGDIGQGIVDILSTPLYATAALANAGIESKVGDGNAFDLFGWKIGFSPSAFVDSFKNRETFSSIWRDHDLSGGGWVGFGLDVALDPIMYMSFGVSSGAKVGVAGGTKIGTKTIAAGGQKLTLTRHGERMYNVAQHELKPRIAQKLAAQNADRAAKGLEPLKYLDDAALLKVHDETAAFMIDNYSSIQARLQGGLGRGKYFGPKEGALRQKALSKKIGFGLGPEHMFRETAGVLGKDIGMTATVGRGFGTTAGFGIGVSVGGIFGDTLPQLLGGAVGGAAGLKVADWAWGAGTSASRAFSREIDLPNDIKVFAQEVNNETKGLITESVRKIEDNFKGLSVEDRVLITHALDLGDEALVREAGTGRILSAMLDGKYVSDEILEKINFVKEDFQRILKAEREAGFATEEVRDYVMRIFSDPKAMRLAEMSIKGNYKTGDLALKSKNSFQFHRQVASLDDFIASVGDDFVEQDIAKILAKREALSIKMRQQEKLFDYIKSTAGIPTAITYSALKDGKRAAAGLRSILRRQRGAEDVRLWQFDNYFGVKESIGVRLGFDGTMDSVKSVELIDYLATPVGKRLSSKPSFKPTSFANAYPEINRTLRFKRSGATAATEIDAVDFLKIAYQSHPEDLLTLLKTSAAREGKALTSRDVNTFVKKLDGWARKEFEAPLAHVFPDFTKRLELALAGDIKFGLKKPIVKDGKIISLLRKDSDKMLKKLSDELRTPVKSKGLQAELPQEIELRAKAWRMRRGDFSDTASLSEKQASDIANYSKRLGMTHGELTPVLQSLTGKSDLFNLSAREADRVSDFLGFHLEDVLKKKESVLKRKTVTGRAKVISPLFGEGSVVVKFDERSMPYFEDVDALLAGRKAVEEPSIAEATAQARKAQVESIVESRTKKIEKLQKKADELAKKSTSTKLTPDQAKTTLASLAKVQNTIKKLEKEVTSLNAKLSDIADRPKFETPSPERQVHIGQDELSIVNKEVLDEADLQYVKRKFGFSLSDVTASNVGAGTGAATRKLVRATQQKFKAAKKSHDEAMKALNKYEEGITGELTKGQKAHRTKLRKNLAKAERDLFKIEAGLKSGKVQLLGNGKYRVTETGKIYDLIMKKRGKGFHVLGKHADDVQQAVIRDAILHKRKKVSGYFAATADELPQTIVGAAGGKYVVPASVAHMIKESINPLYNPETAELANRLLRGFDKVQQIYKIPMLGPWGSTWMRNAIGNVSIAYIKTGMAILHPRHFNEYMKQLHYTWAMESPKYRAMHGYKGLDDRRLVELGNQKIKGVLGEEVHGSLTRKQMLKEMGNRGVLTGMHHEEIVLDSVGGLKGKLAGGVMGGAIAGSMAGPVGAAAGMVGGFLAGNHIAKMRYAFKVGELATEYPTRMMLGMHTYQTTGSLREMGGVVNHFLHDYSMLTTFEKRLVRRMMPFYNFTKLALRATTDGMVNYPGRTLMPYKVFRSQNVTSGVQPEDYPDFYHSQFVFLSKEYDEEEGFKSWIPGLTGPEGSGVSVMSGFHPPLQEVLNLFDIVGPGGKDIRKLASKGPFLFTSIVEAITNYDTFRGGKIVPERPGEKTTFTRGTAFKSAPQWLKNIVQYDENTNTVSPGMAWLLGELPTARFTRVAQQIYNVEDEETLAGMNFNALSSAVLGVSIHRYDAETQQYYVNKAKLEAMENVLMNIGWMRKYESLATDPTVKSMRRSQETINRTNSSSRHIDAQMRFRQKNRRNRR